MSDEKKFKSATGWHAFDRVDINRQIRRFSLYPTAERKISEIRKQRIDFIAERDGGLICHICTRSLTYAQATFDHIKPRSKGGTNALWNLKLACRPCNLKRGDEDL